MNDNRHQESRPPRVSTAVTLLYLTLGMGIIRSFLEVPRLLQVAPPGFGLGFFLFVIIFTMAFLVFLTVMIGKGRNWARITYLVLTIVGLPLSVLPLYQSLTKTPISGIIGTAQLVLQTIALIFLFQRASSEWFRSRGKLP